MKQAFTLTITPKVVTHPSLFAADATELVQTTVLNCVWAPEIAAGKEAAELVVFTDFAKSAEFWSCIESLLPGSPKSENISIQKNSDGDDPPDLIILLPSGTLGVEITDCSPIASSVMKTSAEREKGGAIPSVSDTQTHREVKEFMARPVSMVKPHFTNLAAEQKELVNYLAKQITAKDVSGNDILLLGNSFMGGWPESEFAAAAKALVQPKHIKRIVLVNQSRCTVI